MTKKAFTLIELLVVIAIISLLVSILLPSLNKAKDLARQVVCSSNLKQIGTAFFMYANDYNACLPSAGPLDYPEGRAICWPGLLAHDYLDFPEVGKWGHKFSEQMSVLNLYIRDNYPTIFNCPGNNDHTSSTTAVSYAMNYGIDGKNLDRLIRSNPKTILLVDNNPPSDQWNQTRKWDDGNRQSEGCHNDGVNILCVDGRVEWLETIMTTYGWLGVASDAYPEYWKNDENQY